MLKHEESDVLCSLILKSIYTFMRDWTSVIVRNNLSLDRTNSCFDTALTLIKEIINSRPLKEKIKFLTKKNRHINKKKIMKKIKCRKKEKFRTEILVFS